jgi:transcriptional regulator with XRE-family HTH domain
MTPLSNGERAGTVGESAAFGHWLRAAREEREITQQVLADRAGISRSYLSDLERGRDVRPTLPTLDRLATALGLPSVEVLEVAGLLRLPTHAAQRQEEDRLLARYRGLSEAGRSTVERFVRFIHQEEQRWVQPSFPDEVFDDEQRPPAAPQGHPQPITLFDPSNLSRDEADRA